MHLGNCLAHVASPKVQAPCEGGALGQITGDQPEVPTCADEEGFGEQLLRTRNNCGNGCKDIIIPGVASNMGGVDNLILGVSADPTRNTSAKDLGYARR